MTATDGSTYFAVTMLGIVGFVVLYVWLALALAAVFRKSGEEAWKAWVPVLNFVVLLQVGGLSGWLLLLWLVPFAGVLAVWAAVIVACHRIGKAFGFGPGMTVLAALVLPIWASVIGFGASRWVGAEPAPGARRTAAPDEDGLAFLAGLTETARPEVPGAAAVAAYGAGSPPSGPPPLPPAPAGGWVPPPLPVPGATAAAPVAASAAGAPVLPVAASAQALSADPSPPAIPGSRWEGLPPADEFTGEVTGAFTGAPAPISAVPVAVDAAGEGSRPGPQRSGAGTPAEPPAPSQPPVTAVPAAAILPELRTEPWAPSRSPMVDSEGFGETSAPVSAIVGAPDAGAPRSALGSVSALHARPGIPDEMIEETIITHRRRAAWSLVPPSGQPIALGTDVVMLGRRPIADPAFPDAQLIAIQDGTVSKTHARLELRDDTWYITDLDSTNGVLFATVMGTEVEATPGVEVEAGDRFLLGDAEVRLVRSEA